MSKHLPAVPDKRRDRMPAAASRRPSPALLTIADVALYLVASERHVRRLIERGDLPVHRIGKLIRISQEDLARFLAASRESRPPVSVHVLC